MERRTVLGQSHTTPDGHTGPCSCHAATEIADTSES